MSFRLLVESVDNSDSNMAVRWCFDPKTLERFAKREIPHVKLLLVTRSATGFENRWLIPIEQAQQYVAFNSPGDNQLRGYVIYHDKRKSHREMFDAWLLHHENHSYVHPLFDASGNALETKDINRNTKAELGVFIASDNVSVAVSSQFFAQPLPSWLRRYLNVWEEGEAINECEQRSRILFSLSFKPIFLLIRFGCGVLYALYRLFLARSSGIDLRALFLFWNHSIGEIRPNEYQDELWYGHKLLAPLSPVGIVLSGIIFAVIAADTTLVLKTYQCFIAGPVCCYLLLAAFAIFIAIVAGCVWVLYTIIKWLISFRKGSRSSVPSYLTQAALITCDQPSGFGDLAPVRTTIRLRYQSLKARVCRPFAQ